MSSGEPKKKRANFTLRTKLESLACYACCPGLPEKNVKCGKRFNSINDIHFDHIARETISHDNSVENCRPLCKECHALKTFGNKATSAGSDVHMAAKARRIARKNAKRQAELSYVSVGDRPVERPKKSNWPRKHRNP